MPPFGASRFGCSIAACHVAIAATLSAIGGVSFHPLFKAAMRGSVISSSMYSHVQPVRVTSSP